MSERPLGDILKDFYLNKEVKEQLFQAKLRDKWKEITGPMIAQYTTEINIRKQELHLTVSSAPLRNELAMGKAQLLKIANECLGENYLKTVHLR